MLIPLQLYTYPLVLVTIGVPMLLLFTALGRRYTAFFRSWAAGVLEVEIPPPYRATLTPREREVLSLMAEGRSNGAIAARLFVTEKAVGKHIANIFGKLDLPLSEDDNRRVLAVLAYLDRV